MMSVMKQASARRAEKALKEILDKADDNANGRVSGDIVLLLWFGDGGGCEGCSAGIAAQVVFIIGCETVAPS